MHKVQSLFACGVLAGAVIAPLPALAQTGNSQRPPDAPGPTVPGPRPGENLSDQLRRNDGVIPPAQNLDPEISKPPADTGTTPVIPPQGSPGGDNSLKPK